MSRPNGNRMEEVVLAAVNLVTGKPMRGWREHWIVEAVCFFFDSLHMVREDVLIMPVPIVFFTVRWYEIAKARKLIRVIERCNVALRSFYLVYFIVEDSYMYPST